MTLSAKERHARWVAANPERDAANKKAWDRANRELGRERARKWRAANPEKQHDAEMRKFGITSAQYHERLAAQGGVCAICGCPPGKRRLAVDHDHGTNVVRGLLCSGCNTSLGAFRDDPRRLLAASMYLVRSKFAVPAKAVALARVLRDPTNSAPLAELLDLLDGGPA